MFSPADFLSDVAIDLLVSARGKKFGTILADPPWQFQNRTGDDYKPTWDTYGYNSAMDVAAE